ncbi:LysR family transcriptional regulator, partial [Streptomyces minutiscleroticus]|uniref:LysR family transcriptional regulator n=1 Tax=Streptomyces minutiscleroticus TaxID=68238 RepID=UPI0033252406
MRPFLSPTGGEPQWAAEATHGVGTAGIRSADLETAPLRSFVTVVRAGGISRAAATLGQAQPALSQQVRKLERTVGRPLLHRSPSGVPPTRAGEELLPYAERILSLSARALTDAHGGPLGEELYGEHR